MSEKYAMPSQVATKRVGTSGVAQSSGSITADPLKSLHGDKGIKLYTEMSCNSSVISAIRYLVRTWITQVKWYVEPADDSNKAREIADFVEQCMYDMEHSWSDFISDVLTFLDYGWSWFEWVAKARRGVNAKDGALSSKYSDGKFGWRGLYLCGHQSWYKWDYDGDRLCGLVQNDQYNGSGPVTISVDKSIHFRTEHAGGNPESRSMYRGAVLDWYALKRVSDMELIGIQRDFTGIPVMTGPMELFKEGTPEYTNIRPYLETILAQLQRDERLFALLPPEKNEDGMPTGYTFRLESSPGRHQIDTTKVRQQLRANILQSVLAQFIMLGVSSEHGSRSLADSATSNFSMALGAILDNICQTFTAQGISRLIELNRIPQELRPALRHGDLETPDLNAVGNFVSKLSGAGLDFTDEKTAIELRRIASLPTDVDCSCGDDER